MGIQILREGFISGENWGFSVVVYHLYGAKTRGHEEKRREREREKREEEESTSFLWATPKLPLIFITLPLSLSLSKQILYLNFSI